LAHFVVLFEIFLIVSGIDRSLSTGAAKMHIFVKTEVKIAIWAIFYFFHTNGYWLIR